MKALIFVYLLSFGGSLAAVLNPFYGLLAYVALAVLRPYSLWRGSIPMTNYSQFVAIGLMVGWAARGFGDWRFGRARPIVVALGFFGMWTVFTTYFALDQASAWYTVETLMKILVPFMVGMTTIDTVGKIRQLAWVIVLSQGYVAYELNMSYLGGYNRLLEEGFGSLDNNGQAVALVTSSGVAIFLALYTPSWRMKALASGSFLFMVHAILFSFSRGGMVSVLLCGVLAFILIPKRPVHYVGLVLAAMVVLRLAGPQVVDRFGRSVVTAKGEDASADSRLAQWEACRASVLANPLGVGPDQWKYHSAEFGLPKGQAAHSTWLQVAVEMGVPGICALLGFYLLCLIRLRSLLRPSVEVADPWSRHFARMTIASLIGYMVAAQFVTIYLLEVAYYVALMGALVLKLNPLPSLASPRPEWTDDPAARVAARP